MNLPDLEEPGRKDAVSTTGTSCSQAPRERKYKSDQVNLGTVENGGHLHELGE
jgi:hypothetical protein